MFSQNRDTFRRIFCDVYAKWQRADALQPLEQQIVEVLREHPEYHALLAAPEASLHADFTPEDGQVNPFLHLALHLSIQEQVSTDRPPGIRDQWLRLARHHGPHQAEHAMLECLGQRLWEAQRNGTAPDAQCYLECVRLLP
ncbi:MAG: DUF1841 family protein [Thiotrichales bacterium]